MVKCGHDYELIRLSTLSATTLPNLSPLDLIGLAGCDPPPSPGAVSKFALHAALQYMPITRAIHSLECLATKKRASVKRPQVRGKRRLAIGRWQEGPQRRGRKAADERQSVVYKKQ